MLLYKIQEKDEKKMGFWSKLGKGAKKMAKGTKKLAKGAWEHRDEWIAVAEACARNCSDDPENCFASTTPPFQQSTDVSMQLLSLKMDIDKITDQLHASQKDITKLNDKCDTLISLLNEHQRKINTRFTVLTICTCVSIIVAVLLAIFL